MVLDPVPVAAALLLLHDVAGLGQVGHDAERGALSDAERRRHVAEAHAGSSAMQTRTRAWLVRKLHLPMAILDSLFQKLLASFLEQE